MPIIEVDPEGCLACGSTERKTFFEENGYSVVRCLACGILYTWPLPSASELTVMYGQEQFRSQAGRVIHDDRGYGASASAHQLIASENLNRILSHISGRGRFLDVGCGLGHLVAQAAAAGFEAEGIELSEARVDSARQRGLTVHQGNLGDLKVPSAHYQVIAAVNVLSHLREPEVFLSEIERILEPGGLFFLQTGNKAELTDSRHGRVLGDHWGPPIHLCWFGERQLRETLKRKGFEIESLERVPYLDAAFSRPRLMIPGRLGWGKKILLYLPPLRALVKPLCRWFFYRGHPQSAALYVFARKNGGRTAELS